MESQSYGGKCARECAHPSAAKLKINADQKRCFAQARQSSVRPAAQRLVQPVAAGNAGWPFLFRFAVPVIWFRVPEFWTLGGR
jgi:hypothetical protein